MASCQCHWNRYLRQKKILWSLYIPAIEMTSVKLFPFPVSTKSLKFYLRILSEKFIFHPCICNRLVAYSFSHQHFSAKPLSFLALFPLTFKSTFELFVILFLPLPSCGLTKMGLTSDFPQISYWNLMSYHCLWISRQSLLRINVTLILISLGRSIILCNLSHPKNGRQAIWVTLTHLEEVQAV